MLRFCVGMLLTLLGCSNTAFSQSNAKFVQIYLNALNHQDYLLSSTNVEVYSPNASGFYLRAIAPNTPSELIYRFTYPGPNAAASLKSRIEIGETEYDPNAYFNIMMSTDGVDYRRRYEYVSTPNVSEIDNTWSIIGGTNTTYLKITFGYSQNSNYIQFLPTHSADDKSPFRLTTVARVPEPSSFLLLLIGIPLALSRQR